MGWATKRQAFYTLWSNIQPSAVLGAYSFAVMKFLPHPFPSFSHALAIEFTIENSKRPYKKKNEAKAGISFIEKH